MILKEVIERSEVKTLPQDHPNLYVFAKRSAKSGFHI